MIGLAIHTRLAATPDVTNVVADRIGPTFNPEQLPAVVFEQTGHEIDSDYDGPSGLQQYRATVYAMAGDYASCVTLAAAVIAAIDSQSGTWGGMKVLGAWLDDDEEDAEQVADGADAPYWQRTIDFTFSVSV